VELGKDLAGVRARVAEQAAGASRVRVDESLRTANVTTASLLYIENF
jgi:hypothetical protein